MSARVVSAMLMARIGGHCRPCVAVRRNAGGVSGHAWQRRHLKPGETKYSQH